MKKKIKISLILSLAIIFGCFSNVFAANNQNNKVKKMAEIKKSVRVLDNTSTDNPIEVGATNADGTTGANQNCAKEGSLLLKPEVGWKRYDDNNNNLIYNGQWISRVDNTYYNNTYNETDSLNSSCKFKFIGSKIRLIACWWVNRSNNITVKLDGNVEIKSQSSNVPGIPNINIGVFYEKTGLENKEHSIEVINNSSGVSGYMDIDAIDIDTSGRLVTDATGISLNKTTDSLTLGNTDTLTAKVTPDNATNKTVKWTSSDNNIVQVDENTGVITAGSKAGTAIITATIDGTKISTTCTVTVTDQQLTNPTDSSDKAVLNITMTNGQVKQYNVTMDTVNKFIAWYRLRSAGSGDPLYEFNITQTSNPNIIKTDYVVFDKISSFEVDDYTK